MLTTKLLSAMAGGGETLYVDDVFSAYTYIGNGSTQTITNGIDLAGKGGLVWTKSRSAAYSNAVQDTARGRNNILFSNDIVANQAYSTSINSFNANGYTLGSETLTNQNGTTYVGWTFRKAAKFFDVVTYTGDGTSSRSISHNLGSVPGMMIVKRTSSTGNWWVYHRAMDATANDYYMFLESTAAKTNTNAPWNDTTPTSTQFTLGGGGVNTNAETYVAYLFAHDTGTDGLIQCGSFTVSSGTGTTEVNLGWEPQLLLTKYNLTGYNWDTYDSSRGWVDTTNAGNVNARLSANLSNAEATNKSFQPSATGFRMANSEVYPGTPVTILYLAIRRPNKPPTVGTQVYNAIARTGTGAAATVTGVGFSADLLFTRNRDSGGVISSNYIFDRMRGGSKRLTSVDTTAENSSITDQFLSFAMDGMNIGADVNGLGGHINQGQVIHHFFKRAPGVFDVVCYTTPAQTVPIVVPHGLAIVPEMMITKRRNNVGNFKVLINGIGVALNSPSVGWGNSLFPLSATSVTIGANDNDYNAAGSTYVMYLFATKAGISKVGGYTGNGASQTVDCGFTTGARFVLIKRTDATGDWYVWDTVRGIIAGNDPHLSLNSTAAEVTSDDSIDPANSGFIVNQLAATNINVNAASYIFLAFA